MPTVLDRFLEHYLQVCDEYRLTEHETAVLWDRLKKQAMAAVEWQDAHPYSTVDEARNAIRALTLDELAHVVSRTTHGTPIERKRNVVLIAFGGTGNTVLQSMRNAFFRGDTRIQGVTCDAPRTYDLDQSLLAADGGVFVLSADRGIDLETEVAWKRADEWNIPRVVFVLASNDVTCESLLIAITERLQTRVVPMCGCDGGDVDANDGEFKAEVRAATISRAAVPVLCARRQPTKTMDERLLDAIVDYLPSPADRTPVIGWGSYGRPLERPHSDREPFLARCYRILHDQFLGHLACWRIYSGSVNEGDPVLNSTQGTRDRAGTMLQMHANQRHEVKDARAGDIVVVSGVGEIESGDVLCGPELPFFMDDLELPETLITCKVVPKSSRERDSLLHLFGKLMQEDATFKVWLRDDELELGGTDEPHLQRVLHRAGTRCNSRIAHCGFSVLLKQRITTTVVAKIRHGRQAARVRIEPRPEPGITFVNGFACRELKRGIQEGLESPPGGHAITGARVFFDAPPCEIYDRHDEIKIAATELCRRALADAVRSIVEPIMLVEVFTAFDLLQRILRDLARRRADIQSIEKRPHANVIRAFAPLRHLIGYRARLKRLSGGRASAQMQLHDHRPAK